ncbi:MAG: hypothetical protein U0807_09190 [Candidatus Binatia bacterium]
MRGSLVALCWLAAACGTVARYTRPEGDGGWSPAARDEELERRAAAAAVSLDAVPVAEVRSGPLDLATALALAAKGNRRIAVAGRGVDAAAERVAQQRATLLPQAWAPVATRGTAIRSATR